MATTITSTTTTTSPCSSTPTPESNLIHHRFSMSSSSSMKLKTLIHKLIFSHICRMARALSKAKSILSNILKDINFLDNFVLFNNKGGGRRSTKHFKHKHHKVKVYGSFRLHYNWCSSSSHILPKPDMFCPSQLIYYDSTWNSVASTGVTGKDIGVESSHMGLSGYLQWLEEIKPEDDVNIDPNQNSLKKVVDDPNEINKLADMFIASCHEKFKLEKQESYRRFQEMMARSM